MKSLRSDEQSRKLPLTAISFRFPMSSLRDSYTVSELQLLDAVFQSDYKFEMFIASKAVNNRIKL
jgi:hypothetical protein